jgi:hypothetical protein
MVDIQSIAASFHPSRREQETEREVTSRSRARRSRRASGRSSATTAATTTQHKRTVGTVRTPSQVVGVEAILVAAHQLFNNPPSAHAFPSAVEQWCHDIDQLIITAINTPHHKGGRQEPTVAHSRSPSAARALPSTCVPHQTRVLPNIAMADLCDELICHYRGEDSCITIERHCERSRNLERDFESLAPA